MTIIAGAVGASSTTSARPAMWQLFVLSLTVASAAAARSVFSPLQEVAARDLQFSDHQMSLIQGVAASIPVALLAVPIGRITDRGNRARLLLILAAVWTAGTLLTVVATGFWQVFFARMLASVGGMCALIVAISLAADLSPPHLRGRSLFALSLGNMIGAAGAFSLGGVLLGVFASGGLDFGQLAPWRSVHLVFGLLSLVLIGVALALREPARLEIETQSQDLRAALRGIWRRRALIAPLFLGQVTVVMADTAAGIWAAPVLARSYGQTPEQFAGWIGLVILASGVIGAVVGGLAADLGHKSKLRGGILVGAVVAAALSIPGAFFPLMPTTPGFALMLALLLTCGSVTGLVTSAAIAVLVPNDIRGVCLGAFIVIGAIIGFGVAPTLVVWISESLGGGAALRYGLAVTGVASSVIATIGFAAAMLSAAPKPPAAHR